MPSNETPIKLSGSDSNDPTLTYGRELHEGLEQQAIPAARTDTTELNEEDVAPDRTEADPEERLRQLAALPAAEITHPEDPTLTGDDDPTLTGEEDTTETNE